MSLKNKIAIITGASSGLGKAVTEQLTQEGATVFALARNIESQNFSHSVIKVPVDLRNPKSIAKAFATIEKQTDTIDFLVNCAGRGLVRDLENTKQEEIQELLEINLLGNIYIAQEVYKRMIPHKTGYIINVISTSGVKARPDETIYCASKWCLRGFTESLRLAASKHHIRVTNVLPGGMQTSFWNNGEARDTSTYMKAEEIAAEIVHLLKTPVSIAPSELVIERGFS